MENGGQGQPLPETHQFETSATRLTKVLYFYTTMLHYVNLRVSRGRTRGKE
jgi:hypothetical protein